MSETTGQGPKHRTVQVAEEDRQAFLEKNALPKNEIEAYIWFAFEMAKQGFVIMFEDEMAVAAEMADRASLPDLAKTLRG